jgi:hypothetical protein
VLLVQLFSQKPPDHNVAIKIAAHPVHHLPMGLPDDNPSSFGDHYCFGGHDGFEGLASCWQDLRRFLSNFSAKNLLIKSHQVHQIAAHPVNHLPMSLPDDNPSSFGDHYCFGGHDGFEGLASCWQDLVLLVQLFSQKPPDHNVAIKHIRLLLILFIIFQWVYQMIIQAHLEIIMALEVMMGWRD